MSELVRDRTKLAEKQHFEPRNDRKGRRWTSFKWLGTSSKSKLTQNKKDDNKDNKISVIILGESKSQKTLINNIKEQDLSTLKREKSKGNIITYENDTYKFTRTPDLSKTPPTIIQDVFNNETIDMCLLVVEKEFSTDQVMTTINNLSKTTGRPTKDFAVVLPPVETPASYPLKYYSMREVISELTKLAENKHLESSNYRKRRRWTSFRSPGTSSKSKVPQNKKDDNKGKHPDPKVNLILVGMAGTGKSASGNSILGKKMFESRPSSRQVTMECQKEESRISGLHVRVIDTPDLFDDEIKQSLRDKHINKCNALCESDPRVYVLVMQVSRLTDGEKRNMPRKLAEMFKYNVRERTVLLFTCGNDLKQANMTFDEYLNESQDDLREIINECGNKCVLFENKTPNSHQVKKLMEKVNIILGEY